jgi:glycosyltransferase EpsH
MSSMQKPFKQPTVSVVVPIYNNENEVERCLRSIKNQTYDKLQVIIVDDGSPDRSPEIAKEFCQEDPRFSLFSKKNGGLADARNFGFGKIEGEYCAFIDADDEIEPTFIEKLLTCAQKFDTDIALCLVQIIDGATGKKLRETPALKSDFENRAFDYKEIRGVLFQNTVGVWNKLFRTEFLRQNKIQFIKGLQFEDFPFYAETMVKARRLGFVPEALHKYSYLRPGSLTAKKSNEYLDLVRGMQHAKASLEKAGCYEELKASFLDYKWERLLSAYVMIHADLKKQMSEAMRAELASDSADMKMLGKQIRFEG